MVRSSVVRVAAALAVAGAAVGAWAGTASADPTGSGTGLSLNANVLGVPVNIAPIPFATLPPGQTLTALNVNTGLVNAAVLNASSQQTSPTGVASSASVADLSGLLANATAVSSACTADAGGTTGTASILGGTVLGVPVNVLNPIPPNTSLVNAPPVASVILDEQQSSPGSITVTAIHATANVPGVLGVDLPIATSVCNSGTGGAAGAAGAGSGTAVGLSTAGVASATNAAPTLTG